MFTSIIIIYIFSHIENKRSKVLMIILNIIILIYQTSYFLFIVSTPGEINLLSVINSICYFLLGPIFFIFIYTVLKERLIGIYGFSGLFILPVIATIMMVLTDFHQFFYSIQDIFYVDYNQMYKIVTVFNYLCLISGSILFIRYLNKNNERVFKYISYYITGLVVIISVNFYDVFSGIKYTRYMLTPICILFLQINILLIAKAVGNFKITYNYEKKILDSIDESLIITDSGGNILYCNKSMLNKMIGTGQARSIDTVLNYLKKYVNTINDIRDIYSEQENVSGEFMLNFYEKQYYYYSVYPLKAADNFIAGKIYAFRNISKYKSLINTLDKKNKELAEKYETLKRHNNIIRQLIQENERNKIIAEVSNTVGDYLIKIKNILDRICINADTEQKVVKARLREAIRLARSGIKSIRSSVSTLKELEKSEGEDYGDKSRYC